MSLLESPPKKQLKLFLRLSKHGLLLESVLLIWVASIECLLTQVAQPYNASDSSNKRQHE